MHERLPYTVLCTVLYTILYTILHSVLHSVLYTILHSVLYTILHSVLYTVLYTVFHSDLYTVRQMLVDVLASLDAAADALRRDVRTAGDKVRPGSLYKAAHEIRRPMIRMAHDPDGPWPHDPDGP